jgi:hypothetical protein
MIQFAQQLADELGIPLSAAMQYLAQESQNARATAPPAMPPQAGMMDRSSWDQPPGSDLRELPGMLYDAVVGGVSGLLGQVGDASSFAYGVDPNMFTPAPNVAPSRPTELPPGPTMDEVPGGTMWWGDQLGGDTDSIPFLMGMAVLGGPSSKEGAAAKTIGKRLPALEKVWEGIKNPAEAMARAKSRVHIRRNKQGKYIGAPQQVDSPQKLAALRKRVDDTVINGLFGADWYNQARATAVHLAPGNPAKQSTFSRSGAAYSPQAAPPTEVGASVRQHNAKVLRNEDVRPRTQSQADNVARAYDVGSDWSVTYSPQAIDLGPKTGPYGAAKDPNVDLDDIWQAPNDIWQGRVWEYAEDFDRGFTPQETSFLIGENLQVLDRVNSRLRGMGLPEINVEQMQAAAWSEVRRKDYVKNELAKIAKQNEQIRAKNAENAAKNQERIRKNALIEAGEIEGRKQPLLKTDKPEIQPDMNAIEADARAYGSAGIAEAVGRHTAHLTGEARTGAGINHLWMDDQAMIDNYSNVVQSGIGGTQQPVLGPLELYTSQPTGTRGYYVNDAGIVERNPGYQYDTLVSSTPTSEPVLDASGNVVFGKDGKPKMRAVEVNMQPVDRQAMDTAALTEAMLHAQQAGAWSRFMPEGMGKMLAGDKNALLLEHGPWSPALSDALDAVPYDRVNYGDTTLLTSFDGPVDINAMMGSVQDVPGRFAIGKLESGYQPTYLNRAKPGFGVATDNLLAGWDNLDRAVPQAAERTAGAVSARAKLMNEIDEMVSSMTGLPVRDDLMKLRDILSKGGIPALRDWVKKNGTSGLPAVAVGLLGSYGVLEQPASASDQA